MFGSLATRLLAQYHIILVTGRGESYCHFSIAVLFKFLASSSIIKTVRKKIPTRLLEITQKMEGASDEVERLEEEVAQFWADEGFNIDQIEMALNYAHNRARSAVKVFSPKEKERVYYRALSHEIKAADHWLRSIVKALAGAEGLEPPRSPLSLTELSFYD